jgi:hypothetical protein
VTLRYRQLPHSAAHHHLALRYFVWVRDLERDDLLAALEFGALAAGRHRVIPLGARG